jgi:hypothetical protein
MRIRSDGKHHAHPPVPAKLKHDVKEMKDIASRTLFVKQAEHPMSHKWKLGLKSKGTSLTKVVAQRTIPSPASSLSSSKRSSKSRQR